MGAGRAVPTVRMKLERLAQEFNATLIRINPRDYQIPPYVNGIEIQNGALDGIEGIFNYL